MKVKDVMHKGVTCIEPNTPVREIAKHMRDSDIGAIAVKADNQLGSKPNKSVEVRIGC